MSKKIVVYFPEGFADWEGAFILPELREQKRDVVIISENGDMVTSIGGMRVQVEAGVSSLTPESTEALILIGSDNWPDPEQNKKILGLVKEYHLKGILIAAICGATVALARIGMLDELKHTSNDLGQLKKIVPGYRGEKNYQDTLAYTDGNLITATGVGPVDFTFEIMNYLKLFSEKKLQQWYALYKSGTKPPMEFWTSN